MKSGLSMAQIVSRLCKSESGATAIEYALIAGFLSIVILASVQGIGTSLNTTFSNVTGAIK
jgi:pilus assembly protein Flp/PilA